MRITAPDGVAGLREDFALDHLTVIETLPAGLVETAAAAGYGRVCSFVRSIDALAGPAFDLSREPGRMAETLQALAGTGVTIDVAYPFTLSRHTTPDACLRDLEAAAALGARYANLLVYLRDEAAIRDQVGAFSEAARSVGLGVVIEMVPVSAIKSLPQAVAVARAAGPTGAVGVNLDALHLYRSSGSPDDIEGFRDDILYVQVCDGLRVRPQAEWGREAAEQRLFPGQGEFDLARILTLTAGAPASLEIPDAAARAAGASAVQRARSALEAIRNQRI
jgi:sugar phosphate isomerase/epimerase